MTDQQIAFLEVSREELAEGLEAIGKLGSRRDSGHAVLSFASGMLNIELSGMLVRASASGSWLGAARVPGAFISRFCRSIPPGDPIAVSVGGGRLKIATLSIECVWQRPDAARIHLPMEASLIEILRAALNYTPEDIRSSGLLDVVQEAEAKRDAMLDRAMKSLGPLGISREDLRQLLDDRLRHPGPSDPGRAQTRARREGRSQSKHCPTCGSDEVLRIQYGFPSDETLEESRRGEVVLGGDHISAESPKWHCQSCHGEWRSILK